MATTGGTALFALTADDVVEAQQALYRAGLLTWQALAWFGVQLAVVTIAAALVLALAAGIAPVLAALAAAVLVPPLFAGVQWCNYVLLLPGRARRQFARTDVAHGTIELRWTPEQIALSTDHGNLIRRWSEFVRFAETPRLLLLMQPATGVTILPIADLGADSVADIRGRLAAHGVATSGFWNG